MSIRVVLAFIFLANGIPKVLNPLSSMNFFSTQGIFGFLAPIVGAISIVSAILLLTGVCFRLGNYMMIIIASVALITVHISEGFGAGLERNLLIIATSVLLVSTGPGRLFVISFERRRRRKQ
ncbi:MAG: DoxX family protein [Candidatus Heimdallarchaeota archaeon]|nr:DoxX family protein [Candidatus Heimdallarchaeota archaeon]